MPKQNLEHKIKMNKFITDNDFERQKYEEMEKNRQQKMKKLDEELIS